MLNAARNDLLNPTNTVKRFTKLLSVKPNWCICSIFKYKFFKQVFLNRRVRIDNCLTTVRRQLFSNLNL